MMTIAESDLWYSEATLVLDGKFLRAGTLIQCARRWANLTGDEKQRAAIRLTKPVDGENTLQGESIAALASRPGFRFA
jgi:hypothetical protein